MKCRIGFALFLLIIFSNSFAAEAKVNTNKQDKSPWSGKFGVGFNESTGDTYDRNIFSRFQLNYKTTEWNNTLNASGLVSDDEQGKDAERYNLTGEANFYFRSNTFVFARTNNTYDYFAAFDITLSNAMGFGYRLFANDNVTFDIQAGPGDLRQRASVSKEFSNELTLFVKETVNWKLSENSTLTHYISVNYGSPNTHIDGQIALNTRIVGSWGLSLSYNVIHDTFIPDDSTEKNKTDTFTNIMVSYKF
jgi:putative salt-induced outer membrane protein YdiY